MISCTSLLKSRWVRSYSLRWLGLAAYLFLATVVYAQNPIQIENARPGTSAWPLTNPALNHEIEGYAYPHSVAPGQRIDFYVSSQTTNYTITIFRMGWYNGLGARLIKTISKFNGANRGYPCPVVEATTNLMECRWDSSHFEIVPNLPPQDPNSWVTGVYLAKLENTQASAKQSYIIFVVRDGSANRRDLLFQTSVTTYQAYNNWGGKSLYADQSTNGQPAYKVSFNRPYDPNTNGAGQFLAGPYWPYWDQNPTNPKAPLYQYEYRGYEYNMVRWLERLGTYDVTYGTDVDTHDDNIGPALLARHKAFLSVGHDEYWSKGMRDHVEGARNLGVHLGFFGGNDSLWVIRFDNGQNGTTLNTTIVAYKDQALLLDQPYCATPTSGLCTTDWRTAQRSEFLMIGNGYLAPWAVTQSDIQDIILTPSQLGHWVFSNVNLPPDGNGNYRLKGLLGYEPDSVCDPTKLDCTNVPAVTKLTDMTYQAYTGEYNQQLIRGTFPANMTLYTASGALVFSTGSMQWAWGLDSYQGDPSIPRSVDNATRTAADRITQNVFNCFVGQPFPACPRP